MLKLIKILLSIISGIILTVVIIPILLAILFSSHRVQNYAVQKIAVAATQYLGTRVSVDNVRIRLFNRVEMSGVYIEDFDGDTLLYARKIDVGIRGYNFFTGMIRLNQAEIDGAKIFISQDSTLHTNLSYVLAKLKSKKPKTKPTKDFMMRVAGFKLTDTHFKMRKYVVPERPYGINFADLDVDSLNIELQKVGIVNDSVDAFIKQISLREKSGFRCNSLSAVNAKISKHGVKLMNLSFRDEKSDIDLQFLDLDYNGWSAYNDFTHQVKINTQIDNSRLCFNTISYFAPGLKRWDSELWLRASVQGKIDDIAGNIERISLRDSRLSVKFRITGLPDINRARFNLQNLNLATIAQDVNYIMSDITDKPTGSSMAFLDNMGQISLTGNFDGLLSRFSARALLRSQRGGGNINVTMANLRGGARKIDGSVALSDVRLGEILSIKSLGETSLNATINGILYKDSINIKTNAVVRKAIFNGYAYSDVRLNGEIKDKFYKGVVECNDPNADFSLNGTFNFNRAIPKYDFVFDLRNADLHKLGLNRRDSISRLSCNITADAEGTNLYNIDGEVKIKDINYRFNEDSIVTNEISIFARNNTKNNIITFTSDFADIEMRSRLNFADFIPYFKNTLGRYLPSLAIHTDPETTHKLEARLNTQVNSPDNYYIFKARIKEAGEFAAAFVPKLYISKGTDLSFMFNPAKNDFSLTLNSELIAYNNAYLSDLSLTNRNQSDSISVFLRTSEAGVGNMYMPDFSLIGAAKENRVNIGFGFKNELNNTSALINTSTLLTRNAETRSPELNVRFYTSHIMVGDNLWRISSPRITIQKGVVDIERFRILSAGQELSLSGRVSDKKQDTLHVGLNNFDLRPLTALVDRYGLKVSGRTNGSADIIATTGERLFYSKIHFSDVAINEKPLQNSYLETGWNNSAERVEVLMTTESGQNIIEGGYRPRDKSYNVTANIPNVELAYLQPFLGTILGNIEGKAGVNVKLTGTGDKPMINGSVDVHDFAATLLFSKVRYRLSDAVVELKNNNLFLRGAKITDGRGGDGDLDLTLNTQYLSNLTYDLRVTPRRMLALNTTSRDNELFYGTAYASGDVTVRGDKRGVVINIAARSENNSAVFLPFASANSIAEADFIVFRQPQKEAVADSVLSPREIMNLMRKKASTNRRSSVDINLLLDVRQNTHIEMNPIVGQTIKATGDGMLRLRIKPDESIFTMNGQYTINEGKYDFTLPTLPVGKIFEIKQGSTVQWTGNPMDARLNIVSEYRLGTSLAPLSGQNANGSSRKNVQVVCEITLTESLLQPTIGFDVKIPNADTETQNLLQSNLNTQEAVSTQFLSLLVLGSFYAGNNNGVGTSVGLSTGIEYLSNQLGSLVSSDKMKISLGYRPRSELTSDEIQFIYTHELISNKLMVDLEANYSSGNNQAATTRTDNPVTGDFYLTYIVDPSGNLRTRLFSRTIDRFDENQGLQENGVGLYYRHNIKKSLFEMFRRKEDLPKDSTKRVD